MPLRPETKMQRRVEKAIVSTESMLIVLKMVRDGKVDVPSQFLCGEVYARLPEVKRLLLRAMLDAIEAEEAKQK